MTTRDLLRLAVEIIAQRRKDVVRVYRGDDGIIINNAARGWIREYDRFLRPARKLLGAKARKKGKAK